MSWKTRYVAEHAGLLEFGVLSPVPGEVKQFDADADVLSSLSGRP